MITYDTIIDALREQFPELRSTVDEQVAATGGGPAGIAPAPMFILHTAFSPFVIALVNGGTDEQALRRAFRFLEDVATSEQHPTEMREMVGRGVLDDIELQASPQGLAIASRFMGPVTRQLFRLDETHQ